MAELVANCPRCDAQKITFDVLQDRVVGVNYGWQPVWEVFSICRHCGSSTVFVLALSDYDYREVFKGGLHKSNGAINDFVRINGFINLKDMGAEPAPEHLADNIAAAFNEGAKCMAVGCNNAAATMFRLCVDMATRTILPEAETPGLNAKVRRDLGLRLPWLFENGLLPESLKDLSSCIKEDGNDGAHAGNLLDEDGADLQDFAVALLERLYTEPKRLALAKERRDERRKPKA
jgi:hypothetical protein